MWMSLLFQLISVASITAIITIDDKLDSPFSTGCFKRISIGERLIVYDVTRTFERKKVKDCEQECNSLECSYFSFGISASGNGTCEVSTRREIARRRDAEYDLYQRTAYCMEGRPTGYEESCYRRLHTGQRLNDQHIRHSLPCDNLQTCQHQCSIEQHFQCHGFNIRLDESGLGRGICELTSTPKNYLNIDQDFHRDADFDYYEKDVKNTLPNCGYTNEIVSVLPKDARPIATPRDSHYNLHWYSQRPWTLPGYHHPNVIPNFSGYTGKDRSLSDSPFGNHPGLSTDQSTVRLPGYIIIDADRNRRQHEYVRHLNPNYAAYHHSHPYHDSYPNWPNDPHRQICFQREYSAMRFHPDLIRESYAFHQVSHCESMCSTARFNCTGFAFRYTRIPDTTSNCFLTDSRSRAFPSNLLPDRDCDVYLRTPVCHQVSTPLDIDCFSRWAGGHSLSHYVLKLRIPSASVSDCELECLRADKFTCRSFSFTLSYSRDNCFLSDWPVKSYSPAHLEPSPESSIYERGSFGRGCEFDSNLSQTTSKSDHRTPQNFHAAWARDAWQHFTVQGWPCRRGTQCALNKDAGYWSCEVEGGDLTQWDYCCRPQHACGYSQGYSYPWCYVGEVGPDQWRPCSRYFYPNSQSTISEIKNPAHSSEYGPPALWPISYLYPEPPPNETIHFYPDYNSYDLLNQSPKIQFRPSLPLSYPKAIVQKLDVKGISCNTTQKNEGGNTIDLSFRTNFAKKIKVPDGQLIFQAGKSIISNNSSGNLVGGSTLVNFSASTPYINDTEGFAQVSRSRVVLDQIKKNAENSAINCNTTKEMMERGSSVGIGYAQEFPANLPSIFLKKEENAMARFWNWGQANFLSNKRKVS